MANVIPLTVRIQDGTIVDSNTQQFVVGSIISIGVSVSGGDYAVGGVNSLVYYNTGFGIKAFYVTETNSAIATAANA